MRLAAGGSCIWWGGVTLALVLGAPAHFSGLALAGTIDIYSQPGSGSNNQTGTNVGIIPDYCNTSTPSLCPTPTAGSPGITNYEVWAEPPAGAPYEWISYAATGCNSFGYNTTWMCEPGAATAPPGFTATFYDTFTVTGAPVSGNLWVWADDTASVYLDTGDVTSGNGSGGTQIGFPGTLGAPGMNCAQGAGDIGCTPSQGQDLTFCASGCTSAPLAAGTYTLVFDVTQFETQPNAPTSPFGLMYDGQLSTPEPASYTLIGLGLAGLGTLLRRRKRA